MLSSLPDLVLAEYYYSLPTQAVLSHFARTLDSAFARPILLE